MGRKTFRLPSKGKKYKSKNKERDRGSKAYQDARKIRGSQRWKQMARIYKCQFPLCEWCGEHPTKEVHHIKPVTTHPESAFNLSNLLGMCADCHDLVHLRMSRGEDVEKEAKEKKKDSYGN